MCNTLRDAYEKFIEYDVRGGGGGGGVNMLTSQ